MSAFNFSRWLNIHVCWRQCVLQLSKRATARLQGRHKREWEWKQFKLNALAAHTATYFLNSDDCVRRQGTMTVGQQDVRWLQLRTWHDHSCIAGIPLLVRGLTVKLSLCLCNHSSLAGQIAAGLFGHSKCNLLLAQARPRMIQHLSSKYLGGVTLGSHSRVRGESFMPHAKMSGKSLTPSGLRCTVGMW